MTLQTEPPEKPATLPPGHTVLCVDDEKNILSSLKRLLRREAYRLITAPSGPEALSLLSRESVQLVISDQRMPEMSGVELLSRVRELYPDMVRIILSGYTDLDSITDAVNKGHIYKFLLKPWNDETLKLEIREALHRFDLILDNRRLHEQVVSQNLELRRVNESLEAMVRERTRELEFNNQALELSHTILEYLPYPVIGVGNDGIVAFVNPPAQELSRNGLAAHLGDNAFDTFPAELAERLRHVFEGGCRSFSTIDVGRLKIGVYPLGGRFRGRGAVMVVAHVPGAEAAAAI
jgi:CheY-like chemotaxis protein/prolyl-tRNA editing enzyme YbaK/EbsC (Cys-tRNA(Pro) deacylase)